MDLLEEIDILLRSSSEISSQELEAILQHPDFSSCKTALTECINAHLDYPQLNALKAAAAMSDQQYEPQLLSFQPEELTSDQAVYWMLALGEIGSERGFHKIVPYTKTELFHQAFISLAKINPLKAMVLFDNFLNQNYLIYQQQENPTHKHDSGFNTLVSILASYPCPEELVTSLHTYNPQKKKLIDDALQVYRTKQADLD